MSKRVRYRFVSPHGSFAFGPDRERCGPGEVCHFDPDADAGYMAYLESQYGEGCLVPVGSEADPELARASRRIADLEAAGAENARLREQLAVTEKRAEALEAALADHDRALDEVLAPAIDKVRELAERLGGRGASVTKDEASSGLLEAIEPLLEGDAG